MDERSGPNATGAGSSPAGDAWKGGRAGDYSGLLSRSGDDLAQGSSPCPSAMESGTQRCVTGLENQAVGNCEGSTPSLSALGDWKVI